MKRSAAAAERLAWVAAIREPQRVTGWDLAQWDRVVRLARRLRLLSRLGESLEEAGMLEAVPEQARRHLVAETKFSRARTTSLTWMLDRIAFMLRDADYPLVLLKGAAYIGQDLPISRGRLPSDADILVSRSDVADAQRRLQQAGWVEPDLDAHDRRYYHEWSHEVPPMQHSEHALELDLHHNILPPTGHVSIDAALLFQRIQPSKWSRWYVLHPVDQVLHSAAHLFFDSELRDRLRDLVDLDGMLRTFGVEQSFWQELPRRARQLGLIEPLVLAVYFCRTWLHTPVPATVVTEIDSMGDAGLRAPWLRPALAATLVPIEPDQRQSTLQLLAAQMLLARHHYRRLPLRLLIPHLWHKARKPAARTSDDGNRAHDA
jgi:Uncharacterised nucleotidyltransferase